MCTIKQIYFIMVIGSLLKIEQTIMQNTQNNPHRQLVTKNLPILLAPNVDNDL
jgi:hypothetical protein